MTNCEKAEAAWGTPLPEWVERLAAACDAKPLRHVAEDMGVSPAIISLAIRNCHHAPLTFIEGKVKDLLNLAIVPCPVLGMITRHDCRRNQKKPFSTINPLEVQLFRACRNGCKYSEIKQEQRRKKEKSHDVRKDRP